MTITLASLDQVHQVLIKENHLYWILNKRAIKGYWFQNKFSKQCRSTKCCLPEQIDVTVLNLIGLWMLQTAFLN